MAENTTTKPEMEIENILNRLEVAGVQPDEQEKREIELKFSQLINDFRVQPPEAVRTVVLTMLRKHGIDTKYWGGAGKAPLSTIDQIRADNEWISLKAKIVQIWDNRSDAVTKTGLIGDGTGVIKFTIFAKNNNIIPGSFAEGNSYLFENLVSSIWQGNVSVKANKTTTITPCEEDIEVSRRTQTMKGVITAITDGSGLIKRCCECNRALVKGQCGKHGRVTNSTHDLRIKAVFSPFGTNDLIDLIIPAGPVEMVTGLSIDKAKEMAAEALDALVVDDQFRKEIVGRYYEVSGGALPNNGILVEAIKPVNICTHEVLAEALKESGGGN